MVVVPVDAHVGSPGGILGVGTVVVDELVVDVEVVEDVVTAVEDVVLLELVVVESGVLELVVVESGVLELVVVESRVLELVVEDDVGGRVVVDDGAACIGIAMPSNVAVVSTDAPSDNTMTDLRSGATFPPARNCPPNDGRGKSKAVHQVCLGCSPCLPRGVGTANHLTPSDTSTVRTTHGLLYRRVSGSRTGCT
jgi:hypothetical protein